MWKKIWNKIMALLGLFGIFISIIWTWVIIIYDIMSSSWNDNDFTKQLTQEELNKLLEAYSGSLIWTWSNISSWSIVDNSFE